MFDLIGLAIHLTLIACFIYVLVQFFQHGQAVMGIVCLLTTCFCGIGPIIAFAYGWIKSGELNIKGLMLIWTIAIIAAVVLSLTYTPVHIQYMQREARLLMR